MNVTSTEININYSLVTFSTNFSIPALSAYFLSQSLRQQHKSETFIESQIQGEEEAVAIPSLLNIEQIGKEEGA
jgi:hypothetical protein